MKKHYQKPSISTRVDLIQKIFYYFFDKVCSHQFMLFALFSIASYSGLLFAQKTLGLTKVKTGSTETGYVLFPPMASSETYLIDKCGKQIHSWPSNYLPGLSAHLLPDGSILRAGRSNDTVFLLSPGKGGILEKISWDGKVVWSYKLENDTLCQHHDFFPMANGNILVIAWHKIPFAKAAANGRFGGAPDNEFWSETVMEIKPQGINAAQIVWQWKLWDHIIQDVDLGMPHYGIVKNHPELMNVNYDPNKLPSWLHINAIDYNADLDQIVLSCRTLNEIWIIDHSTTTAQAALHTGGTYGKGGDLLYRWGNPLAYNTGAKKDQKLFNQHNAHWIPNGFTNAGNIMIFNNGTTRDTLYSSIEIIEPPVTGIGVYNTTLPYGPKNAKWAYKDPKPRNFYSAFVSSSQRLANGNTLICSGTPGKFFEIDSKKAIVWEYINPVADMILTDGITPYNNSAFRTIYYPDTFSAFKGKTLTAGAPIENNSISYACSTVQIDITPPAVTSLNPALNVSNVPLNTDLIITCNEKIYKGTTGNILIFENNILKETIAIGDGIISINNKTVTIAPTISYSYNSRISILVNTGSFKDSSGNAMAAIDSSIWAFNTIQEVGINEINGNDFKRIYPNPATKLIHIPYQNSAPNIVLVNSIGQKINYFIKNKTNREVVIDISELPNGIYSVLLNGRFSQVFVKE